MEGSVQNYDIIEKIGEGGMGVVFKGVHRTLERPVAIKRLAPHLSKNQNMLERFLKEARLQAKLAHPNVVNIFDLLEWEGEIHLVMEYVDGLSVKQMLQESGRLPVPEALAITAGVLRGLAFMHKNGIVHRDIKPSNIIVSPEGDVKVTDFGIARLVEDDSGLTRFGAGVGTLQYMAPELLKTGEVSFAVDMYGMGVTLYEMLTGHVPFSGNTDLEIMLGHIEKTPPPLELPDGEVEKACAAIVLKALAKDPAARFPSTGDFLAEVTRLKERAGPPASFAPAPAASSASRPVDRRKTGTAVAGATGPAPDSAILETRPVIGQALPLEDKTAGTPPSEEPPPPAGGPDEAGRGGRESRVTPPPEGVAPKAGDAAKAGMSPARLLMALAAALVLAGGGYLALREGETPPPSKQTAAAPDRTASPAPAQAPPAPPAAAPKQADAPDPSPAGPAAAPSVQAPAASPAPVPPAATAALAPAPPAAGPSTAPGAPAAGPDAKPSGAPSDQAAAPPSTPTASPEPAASTAPASPGPASSAPPASPVPDAPAEEAFKASPPAAPDASAPSASPDPGQAAQPRYVYTQSKNVRLRDAPGASGKVLDALDLNTKLELLTEIGEWTQVRTAKGVTAFAASAQLGGKPVQASAPSRPQSTRPSGGGDSGWRIVK
jgi:serine/threonine-protein kinase